VSSVSPDPSILMVKVRWRSPGTVRLNRISGAMSAVASGVSSGIVADTEGRGVADKVAVGVVGTGVVGTGAAVQADIASAAISVIVRGRRIVFHL